MGPSQRLQWNCLCDCGAHIVADGIALRLGKKSHCGCLEAANRAACQVVHGHAPRGAVSVEYQAWKAMKQRCLNPQSDKYRLYGGRGITVCQRWRESFSAFLADMGIKPQPELSLDRIDNDGPYAPDNCRWATASQQNSNRRLAA